MKTLLTSAILTMILSTVELKPALAQPKMLRHVVLFGFKEGTSPEDIARVETAFKELPQKIKQIKDFEWGTNNSPENLNQGLTHCFLLTFASEKDRDDYLVHPDHKVFGNLVGPYIGKVTVVDYWAESAKKGASAGNGKKKER